MMEFSEENKDLIEQLSNVDLNLVQKIIQAGLWFESRTFYERTRGTEGTVSWSKNGYVDQAVRGSLL